MPFGRLSPVSETDSESLHSGRAASVDLRPRPLNFSRPKPQDHSGRNLHHDAQYAQSTSSSSSNAGSSRRARDSHGGGGDFTALPDEPRFDDSETDKEHDNDDDHDNNNNPDLRPSLESDRTNSSSLNSELVWDAQSGELRSKLHPPPRRGSDFDSQRSAAPSRRPPNPRSPASASAPAEIEIPPIAELPGDRPPTSHSSSTIKEPQQQQQQRQQSSPKSPRPHSPRSPQLQQLINPFSQIHIHTQHSPRPHSPAAPDDSPTVSPTPQIVKRTSVSQRSERLSISSVHTVEQHRPSTTRNPSSGPTSGSLGAAFAPSERRPSDAGSGDTTTQNQTRSSGESKATAVDLAVALGEKKLAKLKKKGINPELYLEMKAARGGRSRLVGPLVGNTYIG